MRPNCKIEIYNTGSTLEQTLTRDILECTIKDSVTTDSGSFTFSLPAQKGSNYIYTDIGNNYKAKIFFGYAGSYTHLFSGKIKPFTTQTANDGHTRYYEGKGLGEILERRLKKDKRWQNVDASVIAEELADDLGLDSDIDTDTTEETVTVQTETYADVFKKISDYWVNGSTKVTKDFGVDKDEVLFWKTRPLRTEGVETLLYGVDFLNYNLRYDTLPIKNSITVYGAPNATYPPDKDAFTESLTNWVALHGTLELKSDSPPGQKEGSYRVRITGVSTELGMQLNLPKRLNIRDINKLNFWYSQTSLSGPNTPYVRLHAPDSSNVFYTALTPDTYTYYFFDETLGESNEYDIDERPTGVWYKTGNPNWWDIQAVEFTIPTSGTQSLSVDKLYFSPERCLGTASDATSIANYDLSEAEYVDDSLLSNTECTHRAYTLLGQQKNRVLRLDFTVPGNPNVRAGDRLTLSLPPDNILNKDFDVISVEHRFMKKPKGYQTSIHAVDTADVRTLPSASPMDVINKQLHRTREVQANYYSRIV